MSTRRIVVTHRRASPWWVGLLGIAVIVKFVEVAWPFLVGALIVGGLAMCSRTVEARRRAEELARREALARQLTAEDRAWLSAHGWAA